MVYKHLLLVIFFNIYILGQAQKQLKTNEPHTIRIIYNSKNGVNQVIPTNAIGAAFDGHATGDIKRIMTLPNIKAMRSVGLKPLSYRLRTELAGEVWHWNPYGTWSEGSKQQGYWISDEDSKEPILISNGYRLPRRGNTHDQANDDDYSRIDDGNDSTFWKSNPYLDEYYSKDEHRLHPQWVIIDFGKSFNINALQINWARPFAISYQVDYAFDIGNDYFEPFNPGLWHPFSQGQIVNPDGDNKVFKLCQKPIYARFIKITMVNSSNTSFNETRDIRDRLGFAIHEIKAGFEDKDNTFHDYIKHATNNKTQSIIHVSSTDPWHTSKDIDLNTEQAGIDLFFSSGLTDSVSSVMMPIGLLYDTPENMIALLKHIEFNHYPVQELEMGEEPEGQLVNPEDYATLYVQWASKIKSFYPQFKMGGPGFAAIAFTEDDTFTFSERQWTILFLNYLKKKKSLGNFNFFSTEWYPFDDICDPTPPQLAKSSSMLRIAFKDFQQKILPPNIPIYLTEYGYSAYGGRAEVDIEGALMYADILGQFLTLGGSKCYLYGYEPTYLEQIKNCDWGNNMLFGMDDSGNIIYRTAAYYGMYMMTHYWSIPTDSLLKIYKATCLDQFELISSYALLNNRNKWSVAIINKDPINSHSIIVRIYKEKTGNSGLHFPLQMLQYSHKEYKWQSDESDGHPVLSLPPEQKILNRESSITLPPYSLTILKE